MFLTYVWRLASRATCEALAPRAGDPQHVGESGAKPYLLLTYFSRRICAPDRPAAFSASKQASTMSGLPHR